MSVVEDVNEAKFRFFDEENAASAIRYIYAAAEADRHGHTFLHAALTDCETVLDEHAQIYEGKNDD